MDNNIQFIENNKSQAKIKVIGVGGGGGNAINAMLSSSLEGEVAFYAVNTDQQALESIGDSCEKVQIGQEIAQGLGVGANYKIAMDAAVRDVERLDDIIDGADMVFIAAGMGGGTGTGASPIIAERCREKNIVTVAVVTKPFVWENRNENAETGIDMLTQHVDSIIVVPNDKITDVYGDEITIENSFEYSDQVLGNAVSGICEIIYTPGKINVDFADVKTVMSETGQAMMGSATETGVDRAIRAAQAVIECPLLEGIELKNARGMLVNFTADSSKFNMKELNEAMDIIRGTTASSAKIFFGLVNNPNAGDELRITLVATGLRPDNANLSIQNGNAVTTNAFGSGNRKATMLTSNRRQLKDQGDLLGNNDGETPTILRRQHS